MLTASYAAAAFALLCAGGFGLLYLQYGKGWNDQAQRHAEALRASQRRNA